MRQASRMRAGPAAGGMGVNHECQEGALSRQPVSRDPTRSNFGPVHVGPVASELGKAAEPQGGFQADRRARGGPAEARQVRCPGNGQSPTAGRRVLQPPVGQLFFLLLHSP